MMNVAIPSPGESVSEVRLGKWAKSDGDWVEKDDLLVEIESDKATLELLAPAAGKLAIKAKSGTDLKVGAVAAAIDTAAKRPAGAAGAAKSVVETKPTETAARASGVAKKMAADKGIDLARIAGSGTAGRVMKADVERAGAAPLAAAPAPTPPPASAPRGARTERRERMTKLRARIAERLVASQQTTATLTTFNEVDMSEVARLRADHKEAFEKAHGISLGMMGFFIKAAVSALQRYPRLNAFVDGDELILHDYVDIAVAVGTDRGLVVPVIRNAHERSFAELEAIVKDFGARGRTGELTVEEMTGGTFTVSNGGVYGSLMSTPILNPPQSGILGMHGIKRRAVEDPRNPGQVVIRPMMYLAMSYDHRIVDGTEAVQFLVHVKECIEHPERMLLGI